MRTIKKQYNTLMGKAGTQQLMDAGMLDDTRCLGTTTALALRTISTAIQNPGLTIEFQDHHPTRSATKRLRWQIKAIIDTLELRCLRLRADNTICFELWNTGQFIVDKEKTDG